MKPVTFQRKGDYTWWSLLPFNWMVITPGEACFTRSIIVCASSRFDSSQSENCKKKVWFLSLFKICIQYSGQFKRSINNKNILLYTSERHKSSCSPLPHTFYGQKKKAIFWTLHTMLIKININQKLRADSTKRCRVCTSIFWLISLGTWCTVRV